MTSAVLCRGSVVTVASPGVYSGKPRPAVVVQADRWLQAHPSVTLCPLTSTLRQAPLVRIAVEPSRRNGLRKPTQLMVDNHLRMATAPQAAPSAAKDSSLPEHQRQHQTMPIMMQALDGAMRTTVTLDDELLARAEQLCGDLERSALLKEALRALVQRESARRLAALGGSEPALKPIPRRQAAP